MFSMGELTPVAAPPDVGRRAFLRRCAAAGAVAWAAPVVTSVQPAAAQAASPAPQPEQGPQVLGVQLDRDVSPAVLPRTGVDAGTLAALGAASVAAGAAALARDGKRRRVWAAAAGNEETAP